MSLMELDSTAVERLGQDNDFSDPNVITKYRTAADIANEVMKQVLAACRIGCNVVDLCRMGDKLIMEMTSRVFKKGQLERGIARPTCVSIDNVICNFSPLEDDTTLLKAGDVVKIDLGVHIDGYIASLAHTTVLNPTPQTPITGRAADVICATYYAAQVATRLVAAGRPSTEITHAIAKVAAAYNCAPVANTASHQIKRFLPETDREIPNSSSDSESEPFDIGQDEAYTIDVLLTSNTSPTQHYNELPTPRPYVLTRDVNTQYALKLKASRAAYTEATQRFSVFPFALRELASTDSKHRLGVQECVNHGLLKPRLVALEKNNEYVARFMATVLVMQSGALRITAGDLPLP
ncbi:hypothetical protein BC832DRAFT_551908 [Gaertneriomyces semiglobifer]|nr:hypothetical protein BC832DRAFT_551908 [Gaertneriomyces semiglobifer]